MRFPCRRPLLVAVAALAATSGCVQAGSRPVAARVDPAPYAAKLSMARLLERQGQSGPAARSYRELAQAHPQEAEPLHRLAILEAQQGRKSSAEALFRQAVNLAPRDVELLNDFGYWLSLEDRLAESEAVLRAALAIAPDHKMVCNNLGVVVSRRGQFAGGLDFFRRSGSEADAQANLAFIQTQLGRLDLAREHYQRALELDPTLTPAAEALVQLAARTSDPSVGAAAGAADPRPEIPPARSGPAPPGRCR